MILRWQSALHSLDVLHSVDFMYAYKIYMQTIICFICFHLLQSQKSLHFNFLHEGILPSWVYSFFFSSERWFSFYQ